MHREGAELAFTYQTEKLRPRVEKIAAEFGSDICVEMEVSCLEYKVYLNSFAFITTQLELEESARGNLQSSEADIKSAEKGN